MQNQPPQPWAYTQPQAPIPPGPWNAPSAPTWMPPDQYVAAQMHMASMYANAWAPSPSYGSFVRRFGALMIDMVLVFLAFFVIGIATATGGEQFGGQTFQNLDKFGAGGTVVLNAFLTALTIAFNALGGTPGKRMLGLKITNREGNVPGPVLATLRAWPWIVLTLCNLVMFMSVRMSDSGDVSSSLLEGVTLLAEGIWLVGCFFVFGTKYKQALHDKLAGTYVIRP